MNVFLITERSWISDENLSSAIEMGWDGGKWWKKSWEIFSNVLRACGRGFEVLAAVKHWWIFFGRREGGKLGHLSQTVWANISTQSPHDPLYDSICKRQRSICMSLFGKSKFIVSPQPYSESHIVPSVRNGQIKQWHCRRWFFCWTHNKETRRESWGKCAITIKLKEY